MTSVVSNLSIQQLHHDPAIRLPQARRRPAESKELLQKLLPDGRFLINPKQIPPDKTATRT